MASCFREARAFDRDSKNVRAAQARLLMRIVGRHRRTWFGRMHGFASIRSVAGFQNSVPLSTYDDYRQAIDRVASGQQNVLTADRVQLLEPTGGSTLGEKLVPYTAALKRCFQRAIRLWIWDLYSQRPAVRCGRSYWSISPLAHTGRRTAAGIPIGFDDDAAYLGRLERHLVQQTMVVPREVALCPSVADAQYATLFFLMRAPDVSLISVWSPTFLIELLKLLWARWDELCHDVATGRITIGPATGQFGPRQERADFLRHIFCAAEHVAPCVPAIWPSLALVSCWADGPSLVPANNLRQYLPEVEIQPKGLLATEAFVSVPLVSCAAPVLAIRSHFFEFQSVDGPRAQNDSRTLLADELSAGHRYRVVVTTEGGLYRYQLHDEVEVVGFMADVPQLRFVGKTDDISDIVGEKLDAAHVEAVLLAAFHELQLAPTYSRLIAKASSPSHYLLQIAAVAVEENTPLQHRLCAAVEIGLCTNPGYRYARAIGQLGPLKVEILNQQAADETTGRHIAVRVAGGQRLGDIKPATIYHKRT
jgi:hypothetical protein